ncbi:MAG: catalase family protein [Rhizomicrobium sp.]
MSAPDEQASLLISDAQSGTPPEAIPPGEAQAIDIIEQIIETGVRAQNAVDPPARRDAHPKPHGCVAAEFRVLDGLAPNLRHGIFAVPKTYQAWIRFSNSSGKPQSDADGDGRGMAIKLVGVRDSPSGTQDFITISHPVFIVRNVLDYVILQQNLANPLKFFVPGWNPLTWRIREAWNAFQIERQKPSNVLNLRYWSMTSYMLGDTPVKFSNVPVGTPSSFNDRNGDNFLRTNLVSALNAGEATFDFCVQLRTDPNTMPIEDPTVAWAESASPFIPVARITIPRQVFDTPAQNAFGENLSFSPWHGLEAHRPLGGINRVRRSVYQAISRLRHELNHTLAEEPKLGPATKPS